MSTRLLTVLAAYVLLPAAAAFLGYRTFATPAWPWFAAPAAATVLFFDFTFGGRRASREFLARRQVELTWREATQFLARHTLWHATPWAAGGSRPWT